MSFLASWAADAVSKASAALDSVDQQAAVKVKEVQQQIKAAAPSSAASILGLDDETTQEEGEQQTHSEDVHASNAELSALTAGDNSAASPSASPESAISIIVSDSGISASPPRLVTKRDPSVHDEVSPANRSAESPHSASIPPLHDSKVSSSRSHTPPSSTKSISRTPSGSSLLTQIVNRLSPSTSPAQTPRKLAATGKDVPSGPPAPLSKSASASNSAPAVSAQLDALQSENALLKSDVSELTNEIASLKNVWHDARSQNAKLKTLLESAKELYETKLNEAKDQHKQGLKLAEENAKAAADAKEKEYKASLEEARKATLGTAAEMTSVQAQISKLKLEQLKELEKKDQSIQALQSQLDESRSGISHLEEELSVLQRKMEEAATLHLVQLNQIHAEQVAREAKAEETRMAHTQRLSTFESRSAHLEEHNEEYVSLIANLQRQLETSQNELEKVKSDARIKSIKAEGEESNVDMWKERFESEQRKHNSAALIWKDKVSSLQNRNDELSQQAAQFAVVEAELNQRITELESHSNGGSKKFDPLSDAATLAQPTVEELSERTLELETRLQSMAEHLLTKSSLLERATAEKTSLRLQLENESTKLVQTEIQLRAWKDKYTQLEAEGISADHDDIEHGGSAGGSSSSSGSRAGNGGMRGRGTGGRSSYGAEGAHLTGLRQENAVAKAVGFMDSMGQQVSVLLRRYPQVRVGFGLYVLLIHLWVAFVFVHLMNEFGQETHSVNSNGVVIHSAAASVKGMVSKGMGNLP